MDTDGVLTVSAGAAGAADAAPWKDGTLGDQLTAIVFESGVVLPEDCSQLFYTYSGLNVQSIDLSGADTSNVENFEWMFRKCAATSVDLTGFNTSAASNVYGMFEDCQNLTALDVTGFDTSGLTSFSNMFKGCQSLTSLDVTGFDTSKAIDMDGLFSGCSGLTSLNVTGFDTSAAKNLRSMFNSCTRLTSLDLSGFESNASLSEHVMLNSCSVKTLKLGDRFDLKTNADLPEAQWFSTTAHSFFTSNQIMSDRRKVADTYIKFETTVSGILSIPDEVTSIGSEAFRGVEDTLLVIPRGVVQIADDAFDPESILAVYRGSSAEEWALEQGFKCLVME